MGPAIASSSSVTNVPSAPSQTEAAEARPAISALPTGPGMIRHLGLYRNANINPMVKIWTDALSHKAGSGTGPTDAAAAAYKKAKDGVKSGGLVAGTGVTLLLEAGVHVTKSVHKEAMRVAIGQAQKCLGVAGLAFYGSKFAQNHDWQSLLMSFGYAAFMREGACRQGESHTIHPKSGDVVMPKTGFWGIWAPVLKSQFECSFGNLLDTLANAVEWRHATPEPQQKGFPKAFWNLAHSLKPANIAAIQISAGLCMLGSAADKVLTYMNTNPPTDPAKAEIARKEHEAFENKIRNACARLEANDPEFMKQVEYVCQSKTDEEFSRGFAKLLDSCAEPSKGAPV